MATPRKKPSAGATQIGPAPADAQRDPDRPDVEVLTSEGRRVETGNSITLRGIRPGEPEVTFALVDEAPALALMELAAAADEDKSGKASIGKLLQFLNYAVPEEVRPDFREHLLNAQPTFGIEEFNKVVETIVKEVSARPTTPPSS